jgi:hypothetical protein
MHSQFWRTIAWPVLVLSTSGFGGWATITGKYNAGLSFDVDRKNWGCATSRAFREVARRTANIVRLRFTRAGGRIFILRTATRQSADENGPSG